MTSSIYDFQVQTITGQARSLGDYRGKVLLVVNTASQCGFTPQYQGLERLYRDYHERGFEVLGFPCNQFGDQEPGTDGEIAQFCSLRYDVTFPLFAKVEVNGVHAAPLFLYLQEALPGLLGFRKIKWNFTKFLIGRDGRPIKRYGPMDTPESIRDDIERALGEPGEASDRDD